MEIPLRRSIASLIILCRIRFLRGRPVPMMRPGASKTFFVVGNILGIFVMFFIMSGGSQISVPAERVDLKRLSKTLSSLHVRRRGEMSDLDGKAGFESRHIPFQEIQE